MRANSCLRRSTSALCFGSGQKVEVKQTFKKGTYGLAAFSVHTFEFLHLMLQGGIAFVGDARDAFCGLFFGGSMVKLGIRARSCKSMSDGVDDTSTVAHQARRVVWLL